jgi:hypothetical protein
MGDRNGRSATKALSLNTDLIGTQTFIARMAYDFKPGQHDFTYCFRKTSEVRSDRVILNAFDLIHCFCDPPSSFCR